MQLRELSHVPAIESGPVTTDFNESDHPNLNSCILQTFWLGSPQLGDSDFNCRVSGHPAIKVTVPYLLQCRP
jgi:hypothetical protein